MKIVFLDRETVGTDISLEKIEALGELVTYPFSREGEIAARLADADICIVNKCPLNKKTLAGAENLKLICVTATGTNNLDKKYLEKRGIAWRNVAGYSTESVAQHTFALLFYLYEHLSYYDTYVKTGRYVSDKMFTHFAKTFHELSGKTWGIIGLGEIGRRVASLARGFGCHVQYYSTSGKNHNKTCKEVDFDTLLQTSDIVSVHAPLNDATYHLLNREAFRKMKASAILINVGRGPIVVEKDLVVALQTGEIAAAGLDVLDVEPMAPDSPLRALQDSDRLFITPHIAWASVEARARVMDIVAKQITEFVGRG